MRDNKLLLKRLLVVLLVTDVLMLVRDVLRLKRVLAGQEVEA